MTGRVNRMPLTGAVAALLLTSIVASGCTQLRSHKGYIGDRVLIDSIQSGVDTRESVQATLGRPTFTSQFTRGNETPTWYYYSRDTRQLAFARPSPTAQTVLVVQFEDNGTVSSVRDLGMDQIASIDPWGEETPTLGRNINFFDELFGNIGQVGATGEAGTTADNPGGN